MAFCTWALVVGGEGVRLREAKIALRSEIERQRIAIVKADKMILQKEKKIIDEDSLQSGHRFFIILLLLGGI
jgi:hypothetical protein